MKALTINKKWILTASLLTVLVGHYAYQTSSLEIQKTKNFAKNSGEFVLASLEDRQPAQAKPEDTRPGRPPLKKTESGTTTPGTCTDCKTDISQLTAEDFAKLLARIDALEKEKAAKETEDKEEKELTPLEKKCGTAADDEGKSAKLKASAKRRRAACIKREEAKEELKARQEEFNSDMADVLLDCENNDTKLACLTEGFKGVLDEYKDEKSVPASTVQSAYSKVVAPSLNKALASNNAQDIAAASDALHSLSLLEDKEEYRTLKQTLMNTVKAQTQASANKVSTNYANAKTLLDNKDPQAMSAFQNAQTEHQKFAALTNVYSNSVYSALNMVGDQTALEYYSSSYVGDVNKILASINVAGTYTPQQTTQSTTTTTRPTTTPDGKMTRDQNWWVPVTGNTNISVGSPTTAPTGNRTGRIAPNQ